MSAYSLQARACRRLSAFASALCVFLWTAGCEKECDNELILQSVSPSGAHKAVVFRRSCGATTGWSTHVSIQPASAALGKDGGNVFILEGEHRLDITWSDDRSLRIREPKYANVFKREEAVAGVRIVYDQAQPEEKGR